MRAVGSWLARTWWWADCLPLRRGLRRQKPRCSSRAVDEKRIPGVSWRPGGVGIEIENRHAGRVRHLRTEERFFAGLVAGITALDGLAVRDFEFRRVFIRNGGTDLAEETIVHCVQNALQINLCSRFGLS